MTADKSPPRMSITHIETGDTITAQFNPTEIEETLAVIWTRLAVLGATGEVLQYERTQNLKTSLELGFNAQSLRQLDVRILPPINAWAGGPDLARRWLMAIHYPTRESQDVSSGAPSDLLFFWPGMYSLRVKPLSVKFGHRRFDNTTGEPTLFSAKLDFEARAGRRLSYEDVLEQGTIRHDATSEM